MNCFGKNNPPFIIGDADRLIALLQSDDANHTIAVRVAQKLVEQQTEVLFPMTAIIEAATTLQRRLNSPQLAEIVRDQVIAGKLLIEKVEKDTLQKASQLFDPLGSKQNTLLDAIVATVARKYAAAGIFSFDGWYTKQGFLLIPQM